MFIVFIIGIVIGFLLGKKWNSVKAFANKIFGEEE